jgi:protein phosphatase
MKQITKDHSYVEEMVRMGKVDRADARTHEKKNVITRAVGVMDKVKADFFEVDLEEQDTVLLCTDGLSNMVTDERILEIVLSSIHSEDVARKLIDEANKNGGQDNITAVVLRPYYNEVK